MKITARRISLRAGLVAVAVAATAGAFAHRSAGAQLGRPPIAEAPDAGCSLETARGNYAVYGHGVLAGVPIALVGTASLDGAGNLSGTATESVGGSIDAGNSFAGTYTLGPDCRGRADFDMVHETRFDAHTLELVAADGGARILWLLTETSSNDLPDTPPVDDGAVTISGWIERM